MDHREKTSTFFARLAYGLGRKHRPATVPLSKFLESPAPQTSFIFKLPDELVLSILSYLAPNIQPTSQWVRFRIHDESRTDNYRLLRVRLLRPLSMTCRAMRLRLVPWIWEDVQLLQTHRWDGRESVARKLNTITNALYADTFPATSVRSMTVDLEWTKSRFPLLVKCLQSVPNLHTLEIGRVDDSDTTLLKNALKGVKLPQVKTLILPPAAHPLLRHCRDVENVVCAVRDRNGSPDGFFRSFASNREPKVKRLAIPLATWDNPSRFVAVCPRLAELTIFFPHRYQVVGGEMDFLPGQAGRVHSAISDLVGTCRALPGFDTLQVVRFPIIAPYPECRCRLGWGVCDCPVISTEEWKERSEKLTKGLEQKVGVLEERAIDCLKEPKTGCREGERRGITLRFIRFGRDGSSVKVEEYGV